MGGSNHRSTVGDYVTLQRGTTYKGSLVGEPGPALLGLGSIEPGGGFRIGHYKTYGGDCPAELMLFPGDLYAALKGATKDGKMIGSVARLPPTVPTGRLTQDTVKLAFRSPYPDDASYLHWLLRTPQYREYCAGHAMGSAVVALSRRDFLAYPVPPLTAERKQVVALLDALDDKIELNRRMNETLEAMARALFKSWFIDFDPVRRNAARSRNQPSPRPASRPSPNGRGEGGEGVVDGTAFDHLFPDSFEESELGEIPKGWRLNRLGDETKTLLGGTPSREEPTYWGGSVPWINSGKANEFRIIEPSEFITQRGMESSATKLLPERTTVIAITGATLGQVSIAEIATCANQSIVGVLGSDALPSEFIYFWVKENIDSLIASQTGGAQQHINKNNVNELPIICPNAHVVGAYVALVRSLFDRIKESYFESRTLATLRDTLLPKLISGELRIDNAERFIKGATI